MWLLLPASTPALPFRSANARGPFGEASALRRSLGSPSSETVFALLLELQGHGLTYDYVCIALGIQEWAHQPTRTVVPLRLLGSYFAIQGCPHNCGFASRVCGSWQFKCVLIGTIVPLSFCRCAFVLLPPLRPVVDPSPRPHGRTRPQDTHKTVFASLCSSIFEVSRRA